ncbi:MAG: hypothetical protein V3W44_06045 [Dehalococcoidales bacterium]
MMTPDVGVVLAGFTSPIDISTEPTSMLWMFPLLLSISIVYKATKMRVLFSRKFAKDVAVLFGTISVFMVFLGVALIFLVKLLTE